MTRFEVLFLVAGAVMYFLGTAAGAAAVRRGERRHLAQARLAGLLGVVYHAVFLLSLGLRTSHFPVTSAFEAFVFLSMTATAAALALDWQRGLGVLLVGILPLAAVTSTVAVALEAVPAADPATPPAAGSGWTALHIFTALGSYGAFSVSFVCGILYLVAQRQLKQHALTAGLGMMPSLEAVARLNIRAIAMGAALLAGGIVVGYAQARSVYNRQFDRLDPKIILSTLTFAAYVAVLALHRKPAFRGRRTALASIAGFLLVMVTFWASVFWSDFHRFR